MARTTTNYGYNISDGSDLVNPLVDIFPNWEQLDGDLKTVSNASIGRATELLTGTVHALTRTDTDRNYFAFTATANFTAGDTFTLDGVQVSALTPDGQQLATGAYIIGSEVFVLVKGTLLTFILNPAKAPDSDKLDGHDSSYFATDSDMTQAQNDISDLSVKVGTAVLETTAQDLSGAVNELNTNITQHSFGSPVSIKGYTSLDNAYTCPSDGYVKLDLTSVSGSKGSVIVNGMRMLNFTYANDYPATSLFVRKGMTVYCDDFSTDAVIKFIPIT